MYQVSLFTNTWSKSSTAISIEDFFAMVRNGYWKVPVEGHRNCLAKDRKHDAQTIKDSMACVIPAGVCHKGHAKNNLTLQLSPIFTSHILYPTSIDSTNFNNKATVTV